MRPPKSNVAAYLFLLALPLAAQTPLCELVVEPTIAPEVTVEIVNNSGLSDSDVYVLLEVGKDGLAGVRGINAYRHEKSPAHRGGVPLSCLPKLATKFQSPLTGDMLTVYQLGIQRLDSGRVHFSYYKPVQFSAGDGAPTAFENYRRDNLEIAYPDSRQGGGNLTSIDFYGIPLQLEVRHGTDPVPDPRQTRSFYASTPTLMKALAGLGPAMATGDLWSLGVDEDGKITKFPIGKTDFKNFLRLLSPSTLAAADVPQARSYPYPSYDLYLASLVGKTFVFQNAAEGYYYNATIQRDGRAGYDVVASGRYCGSAGCNLLTDPVGATITVHLPKGGVAPNAPTSMDFYLYACVLNSDSIWIDGKPPVDPKAVDARLKAVVRDIHASINFGFPDSRFVPPGGDIGAMHREVALPTPYPYGGARRQHDGLYNPWAAIFYYLSNSYGHPYSDWVTAASPLFQFTKGDTVRISILPDVRLDAPIVNVVPLPAPQSDTSVSLSWKSVEGATGYRFSLSPNVAVSDLAAAPGDTQSKIVPNLAPGTSYLVSVTALGQNNQASNQLPVQAITTGVRAQLIGEIQFEANLNVPNSMEAEIDGKSVSPTKNAIVNAAVGSVNVMGLVVKDAASKNPIYRGNFFLQFNRTDSGDFSIGTPFVLENNLHPLTPLTPNPSYPYHGNSLSIGASFVPRPYYRFFDTRFPGIQVTSAASPGSGLAPGSYATVKSAEYFGFGPVTWLYFATTGDFHLMPKQLVDMQVLVNDTEAPIQYVSPMQINFIVPGSVPSSGTATVVVKRVSTGTEIGRTTIAMAAAAPALFSLTGDGQGQVAAINSDGTQNQASNPIPAGGTISVYGTGLGLVANAPADGVAATAKIPASVADVSVSVGGQSVSAANVIYSGLAPGLVGVWQLDFVVPETVNPGPSIPVRVALKGVPPDPAALTTIAVKAKQ